MLSKTSSNFKVWMGVFQFFQYPFSVLSSRILQASCFQKLSFQHPKIFRNYDFCSMAKASKSLQLACPAMSRKFSPMVMPSLGCFHPVLRNHPKIFLVGKPYHQQHLGFPYPSNSCPLTLRLSFKGFVEKVGEISLSSPSPSHQNPASRLDFALFARHLVRVDGDLTVGPGCPVCKICISGDEWLHEKKAC